MSKPLQIGYAKHELFAVSYINKSNYFQLIHIDFAKCRC